MMHTRQRSDPLLAASLHSLFALACSFTQFLEYTLRSRRFFFQKFVQGDESDAVILDVDVLGALAVYPDGRIHIDCLQQFPQGIGVKFLNAHILVSFLDELLNIFVLSLLYFQILPERDNFRFQLLLFGFRLRFANGGLRYENLVSRNGLQNRFC